MNEHLVDTMAIQLMENLDRLKTTSSFEVDAEIMPMILVDIFKHCPFQTDHINGSSIEHLIEISSNERMECEIWINRGRLHINLQSEIGKVEF